MSDNNPSFVDIDKTIEIMKKRYSLPADFNGDEDQYFHELAQKKFPGLNLPDWEDAMIDTNTYFDIDYNTVDTSFQTIDTLNRQHEKMVNDTIVDVENIVVQEFPERIADAYYRESIRKLRENNPQTSIGGVNLDESASEAMLKSQIITKEDEEIVAQGQRELAGSQTVDAIKNSLAMKAFAENKDNLPFFKRASKFKEEINKELGAGVLPDLLWKDIFHKPVVQAFLDVDSPWSIKNQRWRNVLTHSVNQSNQAMM